MLSNTATRAKTGSKGDDESANEILSRILEAMHITDVAKDNAALVKLLEAIQVANDARDARDKAVRACEKAELKERQALNGLITTIMPAKVSKALCPTTTSNASATTKTEPASSVSRGTPSSSFATGVGFAPTATKATSAPPAAVRTGYAPTPFASGKVTPAKLDVPPAFEFVDDIKSVSLAWQEYTIGLGGRPAVRDLDAGWGSKWRGPKNSLTNLTYERRSNLYRFIEELQEECGCTAEEAVRRLDVVKREQKASMDALIHWITVGDLTVEDLANC